MPDVGYVAAALGVFLAVTFTLRAAPFLVVERLRESRAVAWLGARMPVGIMVILVIYTLREPAGTTAPRGIVEAVALAVTVGLHLWRRNALLSIVGGTAVYAALLVTLELLATRTARTARPRSAEPSRPGVGREPRGARR